MVLFKYVRDRDMISSDGEFGNPTRIVVESDAVALDQLMEDFKVFALSLGFHPDTVDKVQMVDEEEEEDLKEPGYGDGY